MPAPPGVLTATRSQLLLMGIAAAALAIGGFEAGRKTVDAAAVAKSMATKPPQPAADLVSQTKTLLERDHSRITVREIATVPFSELYDVLRSASREQLLAWARDLEQMPRGPRQRAAVTAYYKSLIQVDHRAAIKGVLKAKNLNMRDVAIVSLMKAAPESIWGELLEMLRQLRHPHRLHSTFPEDPLWNWSRVDPVAVSQFFETHAASGDDYSGLYPLLYNWGSIDPLAAREWLEADPSRQTKDAFRAFLMGWAEIDRAAAIDYALANAARPNFETGINELTYFLFRVSPDDATRLLQLLPPERAKVAMKTVAHNSTAVFMHAPEDYQRPPDVVARWMATQPVDLWKDDIGGVLSNWLRDDADAAKAWLNELQPNARDAAIADYCRTGDSESAEQAVALGLTINDRKLRDEALGELARHQGTTHAEALEAVDQLPISSEQKAYLRKVMPEDVRDR
jgi:hypothetical protein